MIGPAGGQLNLTTGPLSHQQLVLRVPAGALSKPTLVKVTELVVPTPYGFTDYTPIYSFEPIGLKLVPPAKLDVFWKVDLAQGGELLTPRDLVVYRASALEGPWTPLPDSYLNAGFSQASIDWLGFVFVGYPFTLDPPYCMAP